MKHAPPQVPKPQNSAALDVRPGHTRESIQLMRNFAAGGAAFGAAALLALTQIGVNDLSLKIAVVSAAVAVPLYIAYWMVCELHLQGDQSFYSHLETPSVRVSVNLLAIPAAICLILAIGSITWFLFPPALFAGGAAAVVAFALHIRVLMSFSSLSVRSRSSNGQPGRDA